ncbi:Autophagy-related protein 13 [Cyphellophora attinorum]|uniref:Autophagy-related protein 13 n=1 Tax=Cyphellophora attinorum TaxID=1664694 RepID=A0A0N0NLK9_9EURO|nr:Autophagy-related protein 13 [Phialophora attinorum]KPI39298.1 Autophagy-related protein 13 [Phialophora attinorum]
MHQHPRHPPVTASPALSEQTNPTRTNNSRDRDPRFSTQGSGSSEDFGSPRSEQTDPGAQMQRLNQVIQNFYAKAALIILRSRVELAPAYSKNTDAVRYNRWFNIELQETDDYRDDIRRWRMCDIKDDRPPPLHIEVFLCTDSLPQGQRLVILDEDGKRWDVLNALESSSDARGKRKAADSQEIVLERWTIELGDQTAALPADMGTVLPLVYKKSIVLFRALWTYCNYLPAYKLSNKIGKSRSTMAMKLGYRLVDGHSSPASSRSDNLGFALTDSASDVTADYSFGETESPAAHSVYELLSSRFLGADDDLFRPSMPGDADRRADVGSLPTHRRTTSFERPELGHAYGSLSTYHQAGIATGTSPLSALRDAKDYSTESPPTPEQRPPLPQQHSTISSRNSLRAQAAGRRSSFSFQPFKQPTLSASPLGVSPLGTSPRLASGHVPTLGSLTEEAHKPAPNAPAVAARKPSSLTDQAAVSLSSSSTKPAPITRYSSSFSHRRVRLSSGGTSTNRADDDQDSSGRASAASSAQPGSGFLTEAATGPASSGSMQEDDESIQDFLKLLDTKKDLLHSTTDDASAESSTRRTAAALNRFHRMKDSNAALSDSMNSSLMLHRSSSSSSRQLSSVPAMVAATSASTSSSPGKPLSPHTPHTPFAPSRLSAAYSHDDEQHRLTIEEEPPSPSETATSDTAQGARSSSNVPAIDIPNSPRPYLAAYRRSTSAQRRPASDDMGDVYLRSASMGAQQDRRAGVRSDSPLQRAVNIGDNDDGHDSGEALLRPPTEVSPRLAVARPATTGSAAARVPSDGTTETSSARISAGLAYRTRHLGRRGSASSSGRMASPLPPTGDSTSASATQPNPTGGSSANIGGSTDKSIGSTADVSDRSASSSSRFIGSRRRAGSRPDFGSSTHAHPRGSAGEGDGGGGDEDFMPFAMEGSGFGSGEGSAEKKH